MRERILLLYGSEYGTSYDCCRNIYYELYTSFDIDFFSLNDINIISLYKYDNIVIIVSTTGYGCCPHNMSEFWLGLHNNNLIFYDNMKFHLFGLGDSSYDNYNQVAKKLKKKLKSLNANIVNYSLGNYQHPSMHFSNFNIWKNNLYTFLKKNYYNFDINTEVPLLYDVIICEDNQNENHVNIQNFNKKKKNIYDKTHKEEDNININNNMNKMKNTTFLLKNVENFNIDEHFCKLLNYNKFVVTKNERCTNINYERDVRYMNLITTDECSNICGLIKVHPFLDINKTKELLKLLKINYNDYIVIIPNKNLNNKESIYLPINKKIKVLDLFIYFLDLNKIVTPFFFTYLTTKTSSEIHRNKFYKISDTINISDYFSYVYQDKRSYFDILFDFYNYINIDINFLINTLPNIQDRSYSILNIFTTYTNIHNYNFFNIYNLYVSQKFVSMLYFLKTNIISNPLLDIQNLNSVQKLQSPVTHSYSNHISNDYSEKNTGLNYSKIIGNIYKKILKRIKGETQYKDNTKKCTYMYKQNIIELLVCLYKIEINKNKTLKGLCSDYLVNLNPGSFVYSKIQNSMLALNTNIFNLDYTVVYISVGAAFSSLIQVLRQRHYLYSTQYIESNHEKNHNVKQNQHHYKNIKIKEKKDLLFLGFRQKSQDFYFKDEMKSYLYFTYIFLAFSQDVEDKFVYYNMLNCNDSSRKRAEDNIIRNNNNDNNDNNRSNDHNNNHSNNHNNHSNNHNNHSNNHRNNHNYCSYNIYYENHFEQNEQNYFKMSYEQMINTLQKKKKIYVTDIILMLQNTIYDLLKEKKTIILIAGKSRPFSQNLIRTFIDIIKNKEPNKNMEEINLFIKKKIDDFSIILESWY
ncbi:DNA polymerase delta interacting protein, putative [Plasmodium reichenowi]|uniref:DNA polymerase delta interacting protein, putative n=1 Tax=Plasmodium reichenowi TaxID=5854 RepID=A0A151L5C3_PLARE|nr:DNA polymerase delta interacting protein, putative [Plasmodium reichenowi]KYN94153.1 DNA polymerase delta interacting protein, putative [Plasmodium reichenowi]